MPATTSDGSVAALGFPPPGLTPSVTTRNKSAIGVALLVEYVAGDVVAVVRSTAGGKGNTGSAHDVRRLLDPGAFSEKNIPVPPPGIGNEIFGNV